MTWVVMAQIKIYGLRTELAHRRELISDTLHACVMEVLGLPEDKRAHRFFSLDRKDFYTPADRTSDYTIFEITMMSGRTKATRKRLIRAIMDKMESVVGLSNLDVEVCIIEVPAENWGFRGLHGDEAALSYKVEV